MERHPGSTVVDLESRRRRAQQVSDDDIVRGRLRDAFDHILNEPVPDDMLKIIRRIRDSERQKPADAEDVADEMADKPANDSDLEGVPGKKGGA